MADKKITQLTNITGANLADADEFVVVDISADETKAITLGELKEAFDSGSGFVRITGDTMTGDLGLSGADITFGDNDKAIFGASSNLEIYANGGYSYIDEIGANNLNIRTNGADIGIYDTANSQYMARFATGGNARLFYNGDQKIATTSTGIDVTGTVTADGLTVGDGHTIGDDGSDNFVLSSSSGEAIILNSGASIYARTASGTNRLSIDGSTGDISFYEDTGTTPKFFWDASAEGLSLGHTGNTSILDVLQSDNITDVADVNSGAKFGRVNSSGNGQTSGLFLLASGNGGSNNGWAGMSAVQPNANSNNADLTFITRGSSIAERMRIDSSGNVGIGTSSPQTMLHLEDWLGDGPIVRLGGAGQNVANTLLGALEFHNADNSADGPTVTGAIRHYSAASSWARRLHNISYS